MKKLICSQNNSQNQIYPARLVFMAEPDAQKRIDVPALKDTPAGTTEDQVIAANENFLAVKSKAMNVLSKSTFTSSKVENARREALMKIQQIEAESKEGNLSPEYKQKKVKEMTLIIDYYNRLPDVVATLVFIEDKHQQLNNFWNTEFARQKEAFIAENKDMPAAVSGDLDKLFEQYWGQQSAGLGRGIIAEVKKSADVLVMPSLEDFEKNPEVLSKMNDELHIVENKLADKTSADCPYTQVGSAFIKYKTECEARLITYYGLDKERTIKVIHTSVQKALDEFGRVYARRKAQAAERGFQAPANPHDARAKQFAAEEDLAIATINNLKPNDFKGRQRILAQFLDYMREQVAPTFAPNDPNALAKAVDPNFGKKKEKQARRVA